MEIKGRLVKILPVVTGTGRNGEWKRQEIIIETEGTYPRKVCISIWGDKVNIASLTEGTVLNAYVDIESREFNDKWYTSVTAWKVEPVGEGQNATSAPPPMPPMDIYQPNNISTGSSPIPDDLPF